MRSINREALELFGYPRRDIVGKNVNMLMPKSIGAKHNYYLERYQATKIRHILADKQMGLRAVKQDGSSFPISLKVGELQHPGGGGSSFVAFIQDLSAQLEYERIENIFYSLLPKHIADRIRRGDTNIAEQTAASVIFIDCVGFTSYSATATPAEVVDLLTRIFKVADIAAKQYNVIKVKTIGDCWMGACFLQQGGQTKKARLEGHYLDAPVRAMEMVLDFIAYIEQNEKIQVRCGIATGSVLAGCMEGDKPSYDLIGSTVNLASRLQNCASPNGVAVDATTAEQVSHVFQFRDPSKLDLKGLGDTDIYVLEGRRENAATAATLGRHGDRE